ncbi:MAG: hypothetical protein ACFB6R_07415 [Alphaproteobacteria bacterium]
MTDATQAQSEQDMTHDAGTASTPPEPAPTDQGYADLVKTIGDEKVRAYAQRFTGFEALARAAFENRQKLSTALQVPGDGASPEEMDAFWSRLGRPDKPEDYRIERGELAENLPKDEMAETREQRFVAAAHGLGLTECQVNGLLQNYYGMVGEALEVQSAASAAARDLAEGTLRGEWKGADFETNLRLARLAVREMGGQPFAAFVEESGIGNDPRFIRFAAEIGRRLGEDRVVASASMSDGERADLDTRFEELTEQIHAARRTGERAKADRLYRERDALARKMPPR